MAPILVGDISAVVAVFTGGTLLLLAGILLGWGIARMTRRPTPENTSDRETVAALLTPILNWTSGVSTDVSDYRTLIESLSDQIAKEVKKESHPSAVAAAALITQVLEANYSLQARLDNAEATLQQQSGEIAAYISQARTDALTGLNNRRVFDEYLATSLAAWHAQSKPVGVILFDIDHFKILNDTQGHLAGDAVLRELALLLRQNAPAGALLARYGGEEFACVLAGVGQVDICKAAEELRAAVETTVFLYERTSLRVTISCGVAQATFSEDAFGLLKRGDNALYASKSAGRNSVYLHDGYHCVPYSTHGPSDSCLATQEQVVPDFHHVCEELRNRLAQIAIAPVAASS